MRGSGLIEESKAVAMPGVSESEEASKTQQRRSVLGDSGPSDCSESELYRARQSGNTVCGERSENIYGKARGR